MYRGIFIKKKQIMKNFILILTFLLTINVCKSQTTETLIASDYIETFDWSGAWFFNNPTTGYFTNISVTPTSSAVIYGTGNNSREEDWYSLPAVTVDPFKEHVFSLPLFFSLSFKMFNRFFSVSTQNVHTF